VRTVFAAVLSFPNDRRRVTTPEPTGTNLPPLRVSIGKCLCENEAFNGKTKNVFTEESDPVDCL
jgi:hypothetical protein